MADGTTDGAWGGSGREDSPPQSQARRARHKRLTPLQVNQLHSSPSVGLSSNSSTPSSDPNVLLAALGGTPRSQASKQAAMNNGMMAAGCFPTDDLPRSNSGGTQQPQRRKREREHDMDVARLLSEKVDDEDEMLLSIDPSERVEHRSTKLVRREIVIASPVNNDDMEDIHDEKLSPEASKAVQSETLRLGFDVQPVDIILHIFSFLVGTEDIYNMQLVSKRWREFTSETSLFRNFPNTTPEGTINWLNFRNLGIKNKGTEGTCYRCYQRSTGKILAMKRARVFPKGEGVPYYMLRELAVLQGIQHPHIASLEMISLAKDELHVFFPYVDKTLHEIINPTSDPNGGRVLPEYQIRRLLHQLLDAIAYCHRRGVLHRNLKPKHLLIDTDTPDNYDNATLRISDFALVRATGIPRRQYTMEVVTLWYRPPEILMGEKQYSPAVDVWSVGCIFAEMAQGKPLFTGISEIDQLFQIFSKLSTPTAESWPNFTQLPNYRFEFPNWKSRPLDRLFPNISSLGLDLLGKLLTYNPTERISAENALRHPYFDQRSPLFDCLLPSIPMENMEFSLRRHYSWKGTPEYIDLFHAYLRNSELKLCKEVKYLSRQKTLRPLHRSMLVDWLIEVVDVFEMCLRTAFLAVNYTDRFLDMVMVKKTKFQLLGATCLHVASKCEDVSYIGVEDLSMCADNVYNSIEVLKMEEQLLNTLNFTLAVPTALDFLNIYQQSMPSLDKKTSMLAHYLSELALQEYNFLKYLPSCIATCCLSLALYCIHGYAMTPELQAVCQYKWEDVKDCMLTLQQVYSSSQFNLLTVVKKRYTEDERCQVASLTPPQDLGNVDVIPPFYTVRYIQRLFISVMAQLEWHAVPIATACLSVFFSCYIALFALDRSRYIKRYAIKLIFQVVASVVLSVPGAWSFQVTQVNASSSTICSESCSVFLSLDGLHVFASLGMVMVGTGASVSIATRDEFFVHVEKEKRTQLLVDGLGKKITLSALLNKRKTERQIQYKAKFSKLHYLSLGSFIWTATVVALRILITHAQLGVFTTSPWPVLASTILLTQLLAWISFWCIFRLLTFWTNCERYRWCASFILAATIVIPHYINVTLSTHTIVEKSESIGLGVPQLATNTSTFTLLLLISVLLLFIHVEAYKVYEQVNSHAIIPSGVSNSKKYTKAPSKTSLFSSTRSLRSGRSLFLGTQRSTRVITFK